jgi:triosephosphate isomerase
MRRFVYGNWKMNGLQQDVESLAAALASGLSSLTENPVNQDVEVAIFPPFTLLAATVQRVGGSGIHVGAQDCAVAEKGAYTGDISAAMIHDSGASHVILGHSERRSLHGEESVTVRRKAESALKNKLVPVICIGETLEERQAGQTLSIIAQQMEESLPDTLEGKIILAYEPIWAIGTGLVATTDQIAEVHGFLAERLKKDGRNAPILYGGSVKANNAEEVLKTPAVDGVLVGGASLLVEEFLAIIRAACTV